MSGQIEWVGNYADKGDAKVENDYEWSVIGSQYTKGSKQNKQKKAYLIWHNMYIFGVSPFVTQQNNT